MLQALTDFEPGTEHSESRNQLLLFN